MTECPNPLCVGGVVSYGEDTDGDQQCPDCFVTVTFTRAEAAALHAGTRGPDLVAAQDKLHAATDLG